MRGGGMMGIMKGYCRGKYWIIIDYWCDVTILFLLSHLFATFPAKCWVQPLVLLKIELWGPTSGQCIPKNTLWWPQSDKISKVVVQEQIWPQLHIPSNMNCEKGWKAYLHVWAPLGSFYWLRLCSVGRTSQTTDLCAPVRKASHWDVGQQANIIIIIMEICKAPTLWLKALNKYTHIMYIEMEYVIQKNMYISTSVQA